MGLHNPLPGVGGPLKNYEDSRYGVGKLRLLPEDMRVKMTINGHCFLQGLAVFLFSVLASAQGKHSLTPHNRH